MSKLSKTMTALIFRMLHTVIPFSIIAHDQQNYHKYVINMHSYLVLHTHLGEAISIKSTSSIKILQEKNNDIPISAYTTSSLDVCTLFCACAWVFLFLERSYHSFNFCIGQYLSRKMFYGSICQVNNHFVNYSTVNTLH